MQRNKVSLSDSEYFCLSNFADGETAGNEHQIKESIFAGIQLQNS